MKNLSRSTVALNQTNQKNLDALQTSENRSPDLARLQKERQWRAEYRDFIAAYNKIIATEGLPLVDYFLNALRDEALETDRLKDTISDVDLGRKSRLRD